MIRHSLTGTLTVLILSFWLQHSVRATDDWRYFASTRFHANCSIQRIAATDSGVHVLVNIKGTDEYRVYSLATVNAEPSKRWTSADWPRLRRTAGLDLRAGGDHLWVSSPYGLQELDRTAITDYTPCLDTSNPSVVLTTSSDGSCFVGMHRRHDSIINNLWVYSQASNFHDGVCDSLFAVATIAEWGLIRRLARHPSGKYMATYAGGQQGSNSFARLRWSTGEPVSIPEVRSFNDYNISALQYANGEWCMILAKDAPGLVKHLVVQADDDFHAIRIDSIPTRYSGLQYADIGQRGLVATLDSGVFYRHDIRSKSQWIGTDSLQTIPGVGILDRPFGAVLYRGQLWINLVSAIVVLSNPTVVHEDYVKPRSRHHVVAIAAGQLCRIENSTGSARTSITAIDILSKSFVLPVTTEGNALIVDTSALMAGLYCLNLGDDRLCPLPS